MRIVLASQSPRRKALLALLVPVFDCRPSDIDETVREDESPAQYVARVALEKALACDVPDAIVIAADTSVVIDNEILAKPLDRADARRMLKRLSGSCHHVLTAVTIRHAKGLLSRLVSTAVTFDVLSDHLIDAYLNTDEPWDKAGAYAIQGYAGSFIATIDGSYSAVVGLPLRETRMLLSSLGINPAWPNRTNG